MEKKFVDMRTGLLTTTALAIVMGMATPVIAETWVTYMDESPIFASNSKQRNYQIDVASITKHNGWTYANHRICLEYMTDCRRITSVSAQCRKAQYKWGSRVVSTRHNGNEWWTGYEIKRGTRYSYIPKEDIAEEKKTNESLMPASTRLSCSSAARRNTTSQQR